MVVVVLLLLLVVLLFVQLAPEAAEPHQAFPCLESALLAPVPSFVAAVLELLEVLLVQAGSLPNILLTASNQSFHVSHSCRHLQQQMFSLLLLELRACSHNLDQQLETMKM